MTDNSNTINEFELALQESLDAETAKVGDLIEGTIVARVKGDQRLRGAGDRNRDRTVCRRSVTEPAIAIVPPAPAGAGGREGAGMVVAGGNGVDAAR